MGLIYRSFQNWRGNQQGKVDETIHCLSRKYIRYNPFAAWGVVVADFISRLQYASEVPVDTMMFDTFFNGSFVRRKRVYEDLKQTFAEFRETEAFEQIQAPIRQNVTSFFLIQESKRLANLNITETTSFIGSPSNQADTLLPRAYSSHAHACTQIPNPACATTTSPDLFPDLWGAVADSMSSPDALDAP